MSEKSKEREISLIDLCVDILLHWRSVIVVMLVGGILFGAFSYVQSVKTADAQKAQAEINLHDMLTEEQRQDVRVAVAHQKLYESYLDYQKKSILMNVDGLSVPTAQLILYVEADSIEQSQNIADTYERLIMSPEAFSYLMEKCDISNEIAELVTIRDYHMQADVNAYDQSEVNNETVINEKCAVIPVEIVYSNEEGCLELADAMEEYVEEKHLDLTEVLGQHDIVLLSKGNRNIYSLDVLEKQKSCADKVWDLQSACKKQQEEFSATMKLYYDYMIENAGEEIAEVNTISEQHISTPSVSMKYVVLGMLLFAFVYIFCIFMLYIWNTRLRVTDDIKEMFGVARLGVIPASVDKKKIFGFVDSWIEKLQNYNKRIFTEEEAIGLAAVAVKMAAKKEAVNTVYVISCGMQEASIAERIRDILKAENISLTLLNNVLYNQETMAQLSDVKAVVMLEKAGETLYQELSREVELLERQEIRVLGAIIVE